MTIHHTNSKPSKNVEEPRFGINWSTTVFSSIFSSSPRLPYLRPYSITIILNHIYSTTFGNALNAYFQKHTPYINTIKQKDVDVR